MMKNRIASVLSCSINAAACITALALLALSCNEGGVRSNKLKIGNEKGSDLQPGSNTAESSSYLPRFWVEGIYNNRRVEGIRSEEEINRAVENDAASGWDGILFWGADRHGPDMEYFFRSPFLEKQEWAVDGSDRLSPLLRAAHREGLKVMVNIEGVNPYHWSLNHWTPENIKEVARDLINDTIDALFEECFEVEPDVFTSLARTLRAGRVDYISGTDLRAGTIIPVDAITGTVYCKPNRTYGRGPYIVGKNGKFLITASALNWEVAYPLSDLLSGSGVKPTSNVWGIAGKDVTAFIAVETTELEMTIPGLTDGSKIHVVVWDKMKEKKSEETITYKAPFRRYLNEYDFILIDRVK